MAALVLAACLAALSAAQTPAIVAAGRALFDADGCRSCHKIAGVGGNTGPDLTFVGFRRSPAWLGVWLSSPRAWKPGTLMPEFRLRPADREALVAFLSTLKGQGFSAAAAPTGRELFDRVGCVACHGPEGRGGQPNNNVPGGLIPALSQAAEGYTPAELEGKIRGGSRPQPADPSQRAPLVAMPAWGRVLSPAQIAILAAYVESLDSANTAKADW